MCCRGDFYGQLRAQPHWDLSALLNLAVHRRCPTCVPRYGTPTQQKYILRHGLQHPPDHLSPKPGDLKPQLTCDPAQPVPTEPVLPCPAQPSCLGTTVTGSPGPTELGATPEPFPNTPFTPGSYPTQPLGRREDPQPGELPAADSSRDFGFPGKAAPLPPSRRARKGTRDPPQLLGVGSGGRAGGPGIIPLFAASSSSLHGNSRHKNHGNPMATARGCHRLPQPKASGCPGPGHRGAAFLQVWWPPPSHPAVLSTSDSGLVISVILASSVAGLGGQEPCLAPLWRSGGKIPVRGLKGEQKSRSSPIWGPFLLNPSSFSKPQGLTLLLPRAEERWGAGGGHPHRGKWDPHAADSSTYALVGVHPLPAAYLSRLLVTPTPRAPQSRHPIVTPLPALLGCPQHRALPRSRVLGATRGCQRCARPAAASRPCSEHRGLGFSLKTQNRGRIFQVRHANSRFPGTRSGWEARRVFLRLGLAVLKMAAITCSSRAAAPSEWGPLHPTLLLEGHPQPPLLPASPHFLPDSGTPQLLLLLSSARQTSAGDPAAATGVLLRHPDPPAPSPAPWRK